MKSLLSKDEKTKLQETFRSSGHRQAAFAEVNGINPKTLAGWIYQRLFSPKVLSFIGLSVTRISSFQHQIPDESSHLDWKYPLQYCFLFFQKPLCYLWSQGMP